MSGTWTLPVTKREREGREWKENDEEEEYDWRGKEKKNPMIYGKKKKDKIW